MYVLRILSEYVQVGRNDQHDGESALFAVR